MESSIVIRVKNEEENLKKLIGILRSQTNQKFELIIVDNNSIDRSNKIAYDFFSKNRIQVINIDKFSYPRACNIGADKARGQYIVYLSAHSFPITNTWLIDGLSNFKNNLVAGVFAYPTMGKDATLSEKIIFSKANKNRKGGELGNTNSIIRKDLWIKHKFDEGLINSEDLEWSIYWKRKGYEIINDPRFSVYHTHHLGLLSIIKQKIEWEKSKKVINKKFKN